MEVENERRQRELYDTLGIRDDDSLFDENPLSNEPSNGINGTPSHGDQEVMMQESQSGSDGQHSNVHKDEIAYNVEEGNGSVSKYMLMTYDKGNKSHGGKYTKWVNCSARINATLKDNGLWVVGQVVTDHIHQLDPSMSRFMTPHKCLSNDVKRSLVANDIAGIRPSKSIRMLEV
ncbi:hypothetical protein GH714_006741 [Hevea brasiliensis]|uniref:FAR1 domain-containing protein n=1 Tax=Hevea brasiliensis TaxID=3981 RepID=A0A6A6LJ02_HEVBR|nr:hypothetical protein GH714_006741 [Hevea brasiliensis]